MLSASFWRDAVERAAKTVAQVLLALFTATSVIGVTNVSFIHALDVAALAAVVSLLTSVVSAPFGDGTASLAHVGQEKK